MRTNLRFIIIAASIFFHSYLVGQYTGLRGFTSIDGLGQYPYNNVVTDGTKLYGTTFNGGTTNHGVVFSINQDGSNYTVLYSFGELPDAQNPTCALVLSGTTLYGTSHYGGVNGAPYGYGTIFKINTDGTGYTKMYDFNGYGYQPWGSLLLSGSYLYGMTCNNCTIFRISTVSPYTYTTLVTFQGTSPPYGSNPYGELLIDGDTLYGMTYMGGVNDRGTIFKVSISGTNFTTLRSFANDGNGKYPCGSVGISGGYLYGMTHEGGANDCGTLFRISRAGSGYTVLKSFSNSDGYYPQGSLLITGSTVYGMTSGGGIGGGVIFRCGLDGSGYTILINFTYSSGACPGWQPWYGTPMISNSYLYGMTLNGGTVENYRGELYKYLLTPDVQSSNILFSGITSCQFTASWTSGNGATRDVFVKAISSGTASPSNNTSYTANTVFGSGSQIGSTGWYCVYNGTGTSVTVTGLTPNTQYQVMVCEYAGPVGSEQYQTATSTNNPNNQKTYKAWTGGSTDWSTASNWTGGSPSLSDNVEIPSTPSNQPHVTLDPSSPATCNNLVIASGASVTIDAGKALTVNGAATLNSAECLILKSPAGLGPSGSVIFLGSVSGSGSIKAERYIPTYTSGTDGWHFLSSPINATAIDGNSFDPGTNDDLYRWNEVTATWENHKDGANPFNTFDNGRGYLCAYQSASIHYFSGNPNNANITIGGITKTNGTGYSGWNLVGNPFPCALKWNDGNWDLTNFATTSKIMNPGGTYTDVPANGTIPALQAFMVNTTSASTSLVIPASSRIHEGATNWYKNHENVKDRLMLTAASSDNNTYVESVIRFDALSTAWFDREHDSHFLPGIAQAPKLYSIISGGEQLSTNTLGYEQNSRTVSLGFEKGTASEYSITAAGIESFNPMANISLEDTKTTLTQDLRQNPVYNFSAEAGDNLARFILHFSGQLGIAENSENSDYRIFASAGQIVIIPLSLNQGQTRVYVFDIVGRNILSHSWDGKSKLILKPEAPQGVYLVNIIRSQNMYCKKVYLDNND
ncbi:MAG: hypothetical protein NTW31_03040 [Bacteroidetes bacterium]|nr:hypothetical protein [Bacteroidota bacterium]